MKSQLAIARDKYLEGRGAILCEKPFPTHEYYMKNRIACAWIDGVTFGLTCSIDDRNKVAAPGWLKGKP